jgi:hypothetical protein
MSSNNTTFYSFEKMIKNAIRAKLQEMSSTEEEYTQNLKEYNIYMNCSMDEINNIFKKHNVQYWTNTKKYYKVLFLIKLKNDLKLNK